jgi:hypothetical protein
MENSSSLTEFFGGATFDVDSTFTKVKSPFPTMASPPFLQKTTVSIRL